MFESIFEQVGRAPIGVLLIIIGFLLLVLPAALRALAPGSSAERTASLAGSFFVLPSRLLSHLHDGDVRTYVMWIIIGTALLVAVGMLSSGMEFTEFIPGGK